MFLARNLSIFILLLGLVPTMSYAKAKAKKKEKAAEKKEETFEQKALGVTDSLAKRVDSMAESIDIMLAGKRYTRKPNSSSANVNQFVTYREGGKVDTSTDFGINLRLPNLERRWQLRFTSYDEEEENRDLQQQRVRTRARPRDYGAGLFFFEKLGNIKTTFQPRLELKDPLEVSYVLRFESQAEKGFFRLIPRMDLYADPQKGTGEFLSLEIIMELSKRLELSIQNTEEYRERENFFTTQHGISLDRSLDDKRAVGMGVTAGSHNRYHFHLDSLVASVSYAQLIYKDRLSFALTPFQSFVKNEHFKGKSGVTFTLNMMF